MDTILNLPPFLLRGPLPGESTASSFAHIIFLKPRPRRAASILCSVTFLRALPRALLFIVAVLPLEISLAGRCHLCVQTQERSLMVVVVVVDE